MRLFIVVCLLWNDLIPTVFSQDSGSGETTGFGCYDMTTNQCNCAPEVCSEELCSAAEGLWTDGCLSCQCDGLDEGNGNEQESDPPETEMTGFGCYNLPGVGRQCTCTVDVCSNTTCTGEGGIWTDGCQSCVCDASNTTADDSQEPGFGCYSLPQAPMECTCTDDVCSESLCLDANGTWTDLCLSCSCEEGATGNDGGDDNGDTGWGCYDITVNRCGCAPEFCAQETCEEAGGMFTDGCASCQCQETFPPGVSPPEEDNDEDSSPPLPTQSPVQVSTTNPTEGFAEPDGGPSVAFCQTISTMSCVMVLATLMLLNE